MAKEEELSSQSQVIADLQLLQVRKSSELDERLRKSASELKEVNEKLRKANTDLQRERGISRDLRNEMGLKIEQLRSDKETYLLGELDKLRIVIEASKGERETRLFE